MCSTDKVGSTFPKQDLQQDWVDRSGRHSYNSRTQEAKKGDDELESSLYYMMKSFLEKQPKICLGHKRSMKTQRLSESEDSKEN